MLRVQLCALSRPFLNHTLSFHCIYLHTHQQLLQKPFNMFQRSKLAQKFLARNEHLIKKKKKAFTQKNPLTLVSSIFNEKDISHKSIRMHRLEKIFMEKISEIFVTSNYSLELMKIGFQITQLKVLPKISAIHIYWYCSKIFNEEELGNLLNNLSTYLHYELNSQHILGKIPPIMFVKDNVLQNKIEVEKRLQIADFGPDFIPKHLPEGELNTPILKKEISDKIWDTLDNLSESINSTDDIKQDFPSDILNIRQNIFGVNREEIMKNVKKKCIESKGLHRLSKEEPKPLSAYSQSDSNSDSTAIPLHTRTHEIKKWVAKFKKTRKNVRNKKDKYEEKKEAMTLQYEEEQNSELDFDYECDDDFEEERYEDENFDLNSKS